MIYRQLRPNKLKTEYEDLKQSGLIKRLTTPPIIGSSTAKERSSTFKLKAFELSHYVPDGGMNFLDW